MAFKTLLVLSLLGFSSAACTENEEGKCPASYEGEETGFAQLKAHTTQPRQPRSLSNACPRPIALNHADTQGPDMKDLYTDSWEKCQDECTKTSGCVLWTYKYSKADPSNCYLKSQAEWPGSFNYAGSQQAMPANPDRISGGSIIGCYAPGGAVDRADSCIPDTQEGCASLELGNGIPPTSWDDCANACRDTP